LPAESFCHLDLRPHILKVLKHLFGTLFREEAIDKNVWLFYASFMVLSTFLSQTYLSKQTVYNIFILTFFTGGGGRNDKTRFFFFGDKLDVVVVVVAR
jgi:hypothetical protein